MAPCLEAEWQATEAAFVALEAELPYALTRAVADMTAALDRRSFLDRIRTRLDPAATTRP